MKIWEWTPILGTPRLLKFHDVLTVRIWRWAHMVDTPRLLQVHDVLTTRQRNHRGLLHERKVLINNFHQTYSNVEVAGMWVTVTVCWRRVRVRDYRMVMSITSACCCWWEPRVVAAWHEPDAASGPTLNISTVFTTYKRQMTALSGGCSQGEG